VDDLVAEYWMQKKAPVTLRGMNYRLGPDYSVILMSTRPGAPYEDRVEDEGKSHLDPVDAGALPRPITA
jgi:hypothetical protein